MFEVPATLYDPKYHNHGITINLAQHGLRYLATLLRAPDGPMRRVVPVRDTRIVRSQYHRAVIILSNTY